MAVQTLYEQRIQSRKSLQYLKGLLVRWKSHLKYDKAVRIARSRGAIIGEGVVMPMALAKRANKNLIIGSHVSIQSSDIDLRAPVKIGNHVIIGSGVKIIVASHDIDSPEWTYKPYGTEIEDYVWIATDATIMPSCRKISYGTVVGGGSLLAKSTDSMDVITGNPAQVLRKRKCVHSELVVESLLGGDYEVYKKCWKNKGNI